MEITFVGIYADTSPACVSMIGRAVMEPPPSSSLKLAGTSPEVLNADRIHLQDMPHVQENVQVSSDNARYATACFGQIIINDQYILAFVHKILCRSQFLNKAQYTEAVHGSLAVDANYDRVIHSTMIFQCYLQPWKSLMPSDR